MRKRAKPTKIEVLSCYPALTKTDKGWMPRQLRVGRHKGGIAISTGRNVIQVTVDGRGRWFDPATGNPLKKTKRGDALWDAKSHTFYKVIRGVKVPL